MTTNAPAQLALISDDASLQIAQIDGSGSDWSATLDTALEMSSQGMVFMWPSWSPGGDQITVSASSQRREDPKLELWRLRMGQNGSGQSPDAQIATVFRNPRDGLRVIAAGLAHYVYWAESGRALAVVGNVGSGLAVNLAAAHGRGNPRRLVDGSPIYLAWAPDGRAIAVHRDAQLVLFDLTADSDGPIQIQRARPKFRAPVWSQDGTWITFARPRPGGGSIVTRASRSDVGSANAQEELMHVSGSGVLSLVRAPKDDRLAVLSIPDGTDGPSQLYVLDPDTGSARPVGEQGVTAVVWSADGRALLAFKPQPSGTMLALSRYDLDSGETVRLARFQPSAEYATMLTFHDQFAQSHQIVSGCGRWVTFSGLALGNGGSGRRGFGPQNGCYIVPVDGSGPPRRVTAGSISFFPPAATLDTMDTE